MIKKGLFQRKVLHEGLGDEFLALLGKNEHPIFLSKDYHYESNFGY